MTQALRIDKDRLWASLMEHAQIGARSDGGINREALTPEDRQGRDLFASWCRELDMDVAVDALGNMFATYGGTDSDLLPVAIGSHLDTQPFGGKFDGVLGVLAGLEIIRTLHDAGKRTAHPICIVNWTSEEGSRFVPSMAASGVYSDVFSMAEARTWKDREGIGFIEALKAIDYEGAEPVGQRKFAAFLELHIEQGPVLERAGKQVGIVTGAQAMSFNNVTIRGRESHAGTTPMDMRLDPVAAFTRIAAACYEKAYAVAAGRFTVGLIETIPASHSTIPHQVNFTLDLRHPSESVLGEMKDVYEAAADRERASGYEISREEFGASPELAFDANCIAAIRDGVETCGYDAMNLVSGAGHDAVYVARVCPTAMIFTPCKDGISHNPAESITPEEAEAGTNVLLQATLSLANAQAEQKPGRIAAKK
ncbi:MAG: Zn-dependent hydrolase [Paracoccaceae bacterium]|nr:Zn-dependent hydrolase [Paracoccaceae bacterium]